MFDIPSFIKFRLKAFILINILHYFRYMREKFFEDVRNRKVSSLVLNAFLRLQHKIFSRADQAPTSSLPPNRILKGDYDCCQCGPRLK